jgi:hypothetical protein
MVKVNRIECFWLSSENGAHMSKYARQIAQAAKLIAAKGEEVTWRKNASQVSETQPWKNTGTEQFIDKQVSIVFLRPQGGLTHKLGQLMKNTDVAEGGPRGLMAHVDFTPDISDVVIRNGVTLAIKSIDPLAPSTDTILYDIEFA